LLQNLVVGDFAESVDSAGHQNYVFLSFDAIQAVERVVERVELVGLVEAGDAQLVESANDSGLILGEVGEDVGLHVVIGDGGPVVLLQRMGEGVGGVESVNQELPTGGGEFDQQDGGDGGFRHAE